MFIVEVATFVVIDVATIGLASWRVDFEPTFINRGRDHRVNLAPTVNDTMLIHEGLFC